MFRFNIGSVIWIIICLFILVVKQADQVFYLLVFFSALTTIAVFDINNNSVTVVHVMFAVCLIKFVSLYIRQRRPLLINKSFFLFVMWCFISIPFSLLHRYTIVHNINGIDTYVKFNYQQLTQFIYLLMGIVTYEMCCSLLLFNKIEIEKIERYLQSAYIFVLVVALLQHILPLGFINAFLRNTENVLYQYEGSRVSGTFAEPSFMSLFCAPLFAGYMYRLFTKFRIKDFMLCLLFVIVIVDNNSSSGVLGIISAFILLLCMKIKVVFKRFAFSVKSINFILTVLLFLLLTGLSILNIKTILSSFIVFYNKINGIGVSGNSRLAAFLYHSKLGLSNLIPTGYGTVRSYDLLSTWLCSIGLFGLLLYLLPVFNLCIKLIVCDKPQTNILLMNIVTHNIIMFISVPEFGLLSLWIYYGMGYFYIARNGKCLNES